MSGNQPVATDLHALTDAELAGVEIADAESLAELAASRSRVVSAADGERRRIQRDLHEGVQQQLVHAVIALKLAQRPLGGTPAPAPELVQEALEHAESALVELREVVHGILPLALNHRGLQAALDALVSRVRLPVAVEVTDEQLPEGLEAAAYFIVAEALTNTVKHAQAATADITAVVDGGVLRVAVRDDGVGGARAEAGSGLIGLRDRAAAFNGELAIDSPPGHGTVVSATLPIPAALEAA